MENIKNNDAPVTEIKLPEGATPLDIAKFMVKILDAKKAKDIKLLHVEEQTVIADYFVIATGDSTPQVKAISYSVRDKIKQLFERIPAREENDTKNRWNLLDYGDVIVHVLHRDERETYALEKFWNHALKIERETWEKESEEYSEYTK